MNFGPLDGPKPIRINPTRSHIMAMGLISWEANYWASHKMAGHNGGIREGLGLFSYIYDTWVKGSIKWIQLLETLESLKETLSIQVRLARQGIPLPLSSPLVTLLSLSLVCAWVCVWVYCFGFLALSPKKVVRGPRRGLRLRWLSPGSVVAVSEWISRYKGILLCDSFMCMYAILV